MEAFSLPEPDAFPKAMTLEECLELQRQLPHIKFEYLDGIVYEMPGATRKHEDVCFNLARELDKKLEDLPCRIYLSGLILELEHHEGYFYPDVMVECPPGEEDYALNPVLIVEVLSPSTQMYDLLTKKEVYLTIRSLRHLLFVDPKKVFIEHYFRTGETAVWQFECLTSLEAELYLSLWDLRIPVPKIYRNIAL
jgi:Uma2 family endonuclease